MALFHSFINKYLLNNYSLLSSVLGTRDVVFKQNRQILTCAVYSPGRGCMYIYI